MTFTRIISSVNGIALTVSILGIDSILGIRGTIQLPLASVGIGSTLGIVQAHLVGTTGSTMASASTVDSVVALAAVLVVVSQEAITVHQHGAQEIPTIPSTTLTMQATTLETTEVETTMVLADLVA